MRTAFPDGRQIPGGGTVGVAADAFSLRCVSGEFAGHRLAVPRGGLSIGRDPALANLVLSSSEVSRVHARVWPDADGRGLWIEDLRSVNGTFARSSATGENGAWAAVREARLLAADDRVLLADGIAEFRVEAAPARPSRSSSTTCS